MDIWSFLGYVSLSILSGVLTAFACVVIGGVGGLAAAVRRLTLAEQRIEDVDGRITREVKTRAAHQAVAKRQEAQSAKEIAEEHLRNEAGTSPKGRPKVAQLIRRG